MMQNLAKEKLHHSYCVVTWILQQTMLPAQTSGNELHVLILEVISMPLPQSKQQ